MIKLVRLKRSGKHNDRMLGFEKTHMLWLGGHSPAPSIFKHNDRMMGFTRFRSGLV